MKFSIVTPSFNSERFISETIESVISQKGDFEIEYIIVDGGSSDNTVGIIKKYSDLVNHRSGAGSGRVALKWVSEKDRGMYDAINKGFSMATGEVYAWINSNDTYMPGAFSVVSKAFAEFPEARWLKGITSYMDESSNLKMPGRCLLYGRDWIKRGIYGREAYFIAQDSVFWRSGLWKEAGGIDPSFKLAGDYYLWIRFANLAGLYVVKAEVSRFRLHGDQLSRDMGAYMKEAKRISPERLKRRIRYFFTLEGKFPALRSRALYRLLYGAQEFNLIEVSGDKMTLRKTDFYLG